MNRDIRAIAAGLVPLLVVRRVGPYFVADVASITAECEALVLVVVRLNRRETLRTRGACRKRRATLTPDANGGTAGTRDTRERRRS